MYICIISLKKTPHAGAKDYCRHFNYVWVTERRTDSFRLYFSVLLILKPTINNDVLLFVNYKIYVHLKFINDFDKITQSNTLMQQG